MLSGKLHQDEVVKVSAAMLLRVIHLVNWRRGDHPLISGTVRAAPPRTLLG